MTLPAGKAASGARASSGRAPRSTMYDGAPFAWLVDPINSELHGWLVEQVEPGAKVLDVGCGTGALAFRFARTATEVVGVDLSPAMVAYANRRVRVRGLDRVSFVLGDAATALTERPDASFDVATMVLVLHEMPADARADVLREAARLSRRVLCLDYAVPLPRSPTGWLFRGLEVAAGSAHFRAFRDFNGRGGTGGIAAAAGLSYRRLRTIARHAIEVSEIRRSAMGH